MKKKINTPIEFTVPIHPVSVNQAYRRLRQYGMYLTAEASAYKTALSYAAMSEIGGKPMAEKPVVTLVFTFADKKKHDIDNYLKLTLDSFNGILWQDDNDISEIHAYKKYEKNNPSVFISITEIK